MWILALVALSQPAHAITDAQTGFFGELGAGFALGGAPVAPAGGGVVTVGTWFGKYDSSYSIGRHWGLGATGRVDYGPTLRVAPLLEIRRGMRVIAGEANFFLAGGPLLTLASEPEIPMGWTGRAGVGGKFLRHRFWGFTARLEGGVDMIGDQIGGTGAVLFGLGYSRPFAAVEER